MKLPIRAYWRLLSSYLATQRRRMALLTFLGLSSIGVDLASPQILRFFIDTAHRPC